MAKAAVRYGSELRKKYNSVIRQKLQRYVCPRCEKKAVKRICTSQWGCRSCGAKFAGGAYSLTTMVGDTTRGMLVNIKKGIAAKEKR